jgi:Tat protein translocase TatB subunit
MFNVGGGEIIVILLIALVVLGPDKLPSAARQAGKYLNEFRRMSAGFQSEFRSAMDVLPDVTSSSTPTPTTPTTPTPSDPTVTPPPTGGPAAAPDTTTGPSDPTPS